MKTWQIVAVTLVTAVILTGTAFFLIGYFKPKPAGIFISTNPEASVYINGSISGKTPYQKTLEPGEISIKLVPLSGGVNLFPFETKITLISGIQTVIRREFGATEELSSGDIISFDREGDRGAGLIVISTPDNAQVSIDGVPRGFAPYKTSTISPAAHQVSIKAPGYNDRVMTVSTKSGFRLTLFAKLAKSGDVESVNPTPTPAADVKTYVTILQTPTGFLRMRTEPGTKGEEIAELKPGSSYPYLDTDIASGWLKIQYQPAAPGLPNGITGWVSNQYATQSAVPSP